MKWLRQNWLYLLAFTLPFERIPSYDLAIGSHSITLKASFILAIIVIVGALVHIAHTRRIKLSTADKWLIAYVLVMIASVGEALSRSRSLQVIFATAIVLALTVIIENTAKRFSMNRLYTVLIWTAVITGVFGLYQFFGDSLGLSTSWTGLREIYTRSVFGFPRVQSFALEPLFYASFLLLPLMLALARVFATKSRAASYAAVWFVTTLLALTLSRGGLYAAVGGLILIIALLFRQGSWKRLAGSVGMGILAAITTSVLISSFSVSTSPKHHSGLSNYISHATTVTSNAGATDSDRSANRRLAIQAFKANPIIGVGIGNFGYYAQQHDTRYLNKPQVVVNNEYLEILAETGLLGLITLGGFVLALGWQVYRAWPKLKAEDRIWVAGLSAAVFAAAIQFYAVSTLYLIQVWFAIGLLLALTRQSTSSPSRAKTKKA
jgi:O-antigen ligase